MADPITVELVFALPDAQLVLSLEVDAGSSVSDVIARSGVAEKYPDIRFDSLEVGIWGRVVQRERRVEPGDRVEIYRPLLLDPRDARRELARCGLTMRGRAEDE